jgi:hypothetical protein
MLGAATELNMMLPIQQVIPRSLSDGCALKLQESYLVSLVVLPSTFQIDCITLHHTTFVLLS